MSVRLLAGLVVALGATLAGSARPAGALTVAYELTPESQLVRYCRGCDSPFSAPEPLGGSFELTSLPVPTEHVVEAVTAVRWRNEDLRITGTGFVQRIGPDQVAMVIDTRINGEPVLLTSGRRQLASAGELRIHLATPRDVARGYIVTLVARPVAAEGPDADGDGVADRIDNCVDVPQADQEDADRDGVGDLCDACSDTPFGGPVTGDGCSPAQLCPCEGPATDEEWPNQRAYVQCIAETLKELGKRNKVSRPRVRQMIQDAVRSGCGRRILALL